MHHFLPAACCLLAATAASAQTVYVDADRTVAGGNPLNNSASATVNAGRIQTYNGITVLDATGARTVLTLNGGFSTGAVRAYGSTVRLNGGDCAMLHALGTVEVNSLRTDGAHLVARGRRNSQDRFTLTGNNFALTDATAGRCSDSYLNAFPGVSFRLTGTLLSGQAIDAQYFEEGLTLGQAPQLIGFAAAPVPEVGTAAAMLLGLALLGAGARGRKLQVC